ncbi:uncharacterized protein LACBIDRAFT_301371 [Laccaria bicolor S238N-H82]|uniref:Predicted protein n=1 Tax=Laccaria bicolor (strain S238N-H82 / ATCC MYA-4686) TaxID=486041 RepID=B0CNE3_LACBS|nr:uncharacterized protein LACBIDRAFT_301371 [Laccaria bicolor S238N-H82]EDR15291.1 predicted protein [Laccaria bicolor S238N-H82]|eukprot:XP_001873499.1 predicted protein [Laccaria bicolor S238N-H82]
MASISAAAASPPIDLKELYDLFSWSPPRLVLYPQMENKGPSTSGSTRQPAFFDRHFSTKLALKRVVHLPSLVEDIAKTVDSALDAAKHTLPKISNGDFYTTNDRRRAVREAERNVRDENEVRAFYSYTTARFCPVVASTLALHPAASSWISLIHWTTSVSSPRHAVTDAELTFYRLDDTDDAVRREEILDTMESRRRDILKGMREKQAPLITFEFESLSAGPVVTAIPELGDFEWTHCGPPEHSCNDPQHGKVKDQVAGIVPGPDALRPPWNIREETVQSPPTTLASPLLSQEQLGTSSAQESVGVKKRKRNHASDTSEKRRRKRRPKADVDNPDHHDVSAHSLVQQAWVQATKLDTSLIVLHSGNHELICVRHRKSQTLFVSNVIEPHNCTNPGYGKLHVGVYVTSIEDMFDRMGQQSAHAGNSGEGKGGGRGAKKWTTDGLGGGDHPIEDKLALETIYVASKCRTMHMYLQYDVYDSPVPASFIRSLSLPMPPNCPSSLSSPRNHTHGLDECITVVLTSEIGRGATGVALRGTLTPENMEGAGALDVVVKLAFDDEERDSLKKEYNLYLHLRSEGVQRGITPIIGFFDDDADGLACALVMLYAGVPISDLGRNLTATECKAALSTLESIHCADVLHDDTRPYNVLIGDLGVTIIDFGNARRCSSKKAKDKEYAYLQSILQGLAGESR